MKTDHKMAQTMPCWRPWPSPTGGLVRSVGRCCAFFLMIFLPRPCTTICIWTWPEATLFSIGYCPGNEGGGGGFWGQRNEWLDFWFRPNTRTKRRWFACFKPPSKTVKIRKFGINISKMCANLWQVVTKTAYPNGVSQGLDGFYPSVGWKGQSQKGQEHQNSGPRTIVLVSDEYRWVSHTRWASNAPHLKPTYPP